LHSSGIGPEGIRVLTSSPYLMHLTNLNLVQE
jgi:hypothetical protein